MLNMEKCIYLPEAWGNSSYMDMGNRHTVVGSVDTTADSIAAAALRKSLLPDKVRSNRKQNNQTFTHTK